jgi:hypothetical protein
LSGQGAIAGYAAPFPTTTRKVKSHADTLLRDLDRSGRRRASDGIFDALGNNQTGQAARTRTEPGGDTMKKLSIVKLEKRIAPRYVPF